MTEELKRLIGICRCISTKGGIPTSPCADPNCVRCRLQILVDSRERDLDEGSLT